MSDTDPAKPTFIYAPARTRPAINWPLVAMVIVGTLTLVVGVVWTVYVAFVMVGHPLSIYDEKSIQMHADATWNYAVAGGIAAWGFFLLNAAWIVTAIRHRPRLQAQT